MERGIQNGRISSEKFRVAVATVKYGQSKTKAVCILSSEEHAEETSYDGEEANQLALSSAESQRNNLHHFLTATANIHQQAKFQTNNLISRVYMVVAMKTASRSKSIGPISMENEREYASVCSGGEIEGEIESLTKVKPTRISPQTHTKSNALGNDEINNDNGWSKIDVFGYILNKIGTKKHLFSVATIEEI